MGCNSSKGTAPKDRGGARSQRPPPRHDEPVREREVHRHGSTVEELWGASVGVTKVRRTNATTSPARSPGCDSRRSSRASSRCVTPVSRTASNLIHQLPRQPSALKKETSCDDPTPTSCRSLSVTSRTSSRSGNRVSYSSQVRYTDHSLVGKITDGNGGVAGATTLAPQAPLTVGPAATVEHSAARDDHHRSVLKDVEGPGGMVHRDPVRRSVRDVEGDPLNPVAPGRPPIMLDDESEAEELGARTVPAPAATGDGVNAIRRSALYTSPTVLTPSPLPKSILKTPTVSPASEALNPAHTAHRRSQDFVIGAGDDFDPPASHGTSVGGSAETSNSMFDQRNASTTSCHNHRRQSAMAARSRSPGELRNDTLPATLFIPPKDTEYTLNVPRRRSTPPSGSPPPSAAADGSPNHRTSAGLEMSSVSEASITL